MSLSIQAAKERPPDDEAALFLTHKDEFLTLRLIRSKFLSNFTKPSSFIGNFFSLNIEKGERRRQSWLHTTADPWKKTKRYIRDEYPVGGNTR